MGFEVEVERTDGHAIVRASGAGDGPALLAALAPELERSAAAGDTRLLIDLTGVDAGGPSRSEIWDFEVGAARREVKRGPGARTAVVVSDDLLFGLARMFQSLRTGSVVDYGVFRRLEDAERWLHEPPDDGPPATQGTV